MEELVRGHFAADAPVRVLEVGCGVGQLYDRLRGRSGLLYSGIEMDEDLAREALTRHGWRTDFHMQIGNAASILPSLPRADVIVALEVLEHAAPYDADMIVSFSAAIRPKLFVCSLPVEHGPVVAFKSVARALSGYNREYTWSETLWASLGKFHRLPPHAGWHKGFDWRRIAVLVRQCFRRVRIESLPFRALPAGLGTSVVLVAEEPREAW